MIRTGLVIRLGIGQLIGWGTSYYLIGNFGPQLAQLHGWNDAIIYGGFSFALLVMGAVSPLCGRLIDAQGGRPVMAAGSLFHVAGCVTLAMTSSLLGYFTAWLLLGIAMRFTLYDAAFAALARLGGANARRAMGQITLFGGLASTIFWPLGHYLEAQFGLSGALLCYAGFALLSLPLNLSIPAKKTSSAANNTNPGHASPQPPTLTQAAAQAQPPAPAPALTPNAARRDLSPHQKMLCGVLYACIMSLINIINAAMSAHMIPLLAGLGLMMAQAITIASLRGFGQLASRLGEILFGRHFNPVTVTIFASALMLLSFAIGFGAGFSTLAAIIFCVSFGAANGILTITRGTVPLLIFDPAHYGQQVGRLLLPGFVLSALAPSLFAVSIDGPGAQATLGILCLLALATLAGAIWLYRCLYKKPSAT
ncbi:MFS transporter [Thalassospira marina]|uniref:MFS transporter n=1 Tax=Thalassospira marina TaxID=2048283 RepID=A0ABM6QAE4_9PROT|nr:MFS transporter [Thalassospira marina]AUG53516.1 MFS transporter [Thalassospira marina]